MRELTVMDMQVVSGGITQGEALSLGGAVGGGIAMGVGQALGLGAQETLIVIGLGTAAGVAVTAAAIVGWAAGNGLNQYTPIQSWISDMINALTTADNDG